MSKGSKGGLGGRDMLGALQKMQEQLAQTQAELAQETVRVTTGGGAVEVVMSGTQECISVTVAPQLLEEGDVALLQDLLRLALNQAIKDSQSLAAQRLGPLAGGLGL